MRRTPTPRDDADDIESVARAGRELTGAARGYNGRLETIVVLETLDGLARDGRRHEPNAIRHR